MRHFPASGPQTAQRRRINSGKGEQGWQPLAGNALTLGKRKAESFYHRILHPLLDGIRRSARYR